MPRGTPKRSGGIMHVYVDKLGSYVNQDVVLKGWVRGIRSSGKLHFITLRDGSGDVQCVMFKGDVTPEQFEAAGHLRQEGSLVIHGTVRAHPKHANEYEIGVKSIESLGAPVG